MERLTIILKDGIKQQYELSEAARAKIMAILQSPKEDWLEINDGKTIVLFNKANISAVLVEKVEIRTVQETGEAEQTAE